MIQDVRSCRYICLNEKNTITNIFRLNNLLSGCMYLHDTPF
jgi:hypothetical protein